MLRCIGRGAFGEVWLARTVMGAYRAVKVVYRDAFEHERPFDREFEGIQRFEPVSRQHPSQIAILHVGRHDKAGCFYYVMELADDAQSPPGSRGPESAQISSPPSSGTRSAPTAVGGYGRIDPDTYLPRTLKYEQHQRGRLPVDEVLRLGTSLATALDHLHRHGLVHRDIKPSNIIFVNGVPKLADVGLVSTVDASLSVAGTPGYIPPEGAGTAKGDLYSLGKVLYELATGKDRAEFPRLPTGLLEGEEGEALLELSAVLDRTCEADPAKRYESAAEVHADLAMIQSGRSVRRSRWLERRQQSLLRAATALLISALLATGGWLYWMNTAETTKAALLAEEAAVAKAEAALEQKEVETYAYRLNLAQEALADDNLGTALDMLQHYGPEPQEPDRRGWEWYHLWNRCRTDAIQINRDDPDPLLDLAFIPNREGFVVARRHGSVALWRYDPLELVRTVQTSGQLASVAVSPDGTRLATTGEFGEVRLWDLPEASGYKQLANSRADSVYKLAFGPKGRYLAGFFQNSVRIWNLANASAPPIRIACDGNFYCRGLSFHPSRPQLAFGAPDGSVYMVRPDSGEVLRNFKAHSSTVGSLAYSPDGRLLATAGAPRTEPIRLWDVETGELANELVGHKGHVQTLAFTPQGWLISAGADQTVRVWDVRKALCRTVLRGNQSMIYGAIPLPDGSRVITGDWGGALAVWPTTLESSAEDCIQISGVRDFRVMTSDGGRVLVSNHNGEISVWETRPPRQVFACESLGPRNFHLDYAPQKGLAAFGNTSGELSVLSLTGDQFSVVTNLVYHQPSPDWLRSWVHFFPSGARLCAARGIGEDIVRIWNTATWQTNAVEDPAWQVIWQIARETGTDGLRIREMLISSDERLLVLAGDEGELDWWDLRQGWRIERKQAHTMATMQIAFSPDERLLASGSTDSHIALWEVATRREIARWSGHNASVDSLAFSPDGARLATAHGQSQGITIWDWQAQRSLIRLPCEGDYVRQVQFTRDGRRLFARASENLFIWDAPPLEE